jgi:aminopeptidase YwaD
MEHISPDQLQAWLLELCADPEGRMVGTSANRKATELFAREARACGAELSSEEFDCLDYDSGQVELTCDDASFAAFASPFSLGCDLRAPLVAASSWEELQTLDLKGKILLLHGALASSQIMPKNFVFYNPEEHQQLVRLLEASGVGALICATQKQPELNGAVYPTPMFEDGDFDLPSVFLTEEEGQKLLPFASQSVRLFSPARRVPSRATHLQAAFGPRDAAKILVCCHLDTKKGTPGALDNAGGTVVLLALLHLLKGYRGRHRLELVPFNGEDYYAVPSEMIYLRDLDFQSLELCLNLDGVGLQGYRSGICHFNLKPEQEQLLHASFSDPGKYCPIEPWYQGDHAIFAMRGVPSVAFSTENMQSFFSEYAHTAKDTPDLIDSSILV